MIIIGGGLSGLAAATWLLQQDQNKKVLVLEQHNCVGGHAAGFWREGFWFDSGVNSVPLPFVKEAFADLGILEQLRFTKGSVTIRLGKDVHRLSCVEDFFIETAHIFPEWKAAIKRLYKSLKRAEVLNHYLFKLGNPYYPTGLKLIGRLARLFLLFFTRGGLSHPGYFQPVTRYFKRFFPVESEVYHFFTSIIYSGISTFMYVSLLMIFVNQTYPTDGMQSMADRLCDQIRRMGGVIKTATRVTQIVVEPVADKKSDSGKKGQTCTGVVTDESGSQVEYQADHIISAIDIKQTLLDLIKPGILDQPMVKRVRSQKMSETIPILYLGFNLDPVQTKQYLGGATHLIYRPDNSSSVDVEKEEDFFKHSTLTLFSSVQHNANHAPTGKSNLVVHLGFMPEGWLDNWGITDGIKGDRYREVKEFVIEHVLSSLEKVIPDLADRSIIEVCELGTPHTIERFTGNHGGASSGFSWQLDQCRLTGKSFLPGDWFTSVDTIDNLYLIGHQTILSGGIPGALVTARHLAFHMK